MPVPDRIAALSKGGCPPSEPWRIIRRFHRLSARRGLVAYALRTRAPLSEAPKGPFPFDLHVLGLPLAFILSQDQTLRCTIVLLVFLLNLGFRLMVHPCTAVFLTRFLFSASLRMPVLASDFQRTSCSRFPSFMPLVPSESGCKSTAFSVIRKHFFRIFFIFLARG